VPAERRAWPVLGDEDVVQLRLGKFEPVGNPDFRALQKLRRLAFEAGDAAPGGVLLVARFLERQRAQVLEEIAFLGRRKKLGPVMESGRTAGGREQLRLFNWRYQA
jgi:hypothetical protein